MNNEANPNPAANPSTPITTEQVGELLATTPTLSQLRSKARWLLASRSDKTKQMYPPDALVSTGVRRATKDFEGDFVWKDADHFCNSVMQFMNFALGDQHRRKAHEFELSLQCFDELLDSKFDLSHAETRRAVLEIFKELEARDPLAARVLWMTEVLDYSIVEAMKELTKGQPITSDGQACKDMQRRLVRAKRWYYQELDKCGIHSRDAKKHLGGETPPGTGK